MRTTQVTKKISRIYPDENLNVNADKQYGRGGFSFRYHQSLEDGDYATIKGESINYLGPFKKEFRCSITLMTVSTSYTLLYSKKDWKIFPCTELRTKLNELIYRFNDYLYINPVVGTCITEGEYEFYSTRLEEKTRIGIPPESCINPYYREKIQENSDVYTNKEASILRQQKKEERRKQKRKLQKEQEKASRERLERIRIEREERERVKEAKNAEIMDTKEFKEAYSFLHETYERLSRRSMTWGIIGGITSLIFCIVIIANSAIGIILLPFCALLPYAGSREPSKKRVTRIFNQNSNKFTSPGTKLIVQDFLSKKRTNWNKLKEGVLKSYSAVIISSDSSLSSRRSRLFSLKEGD
jgi:hypothetical protein